MIDDDKLERDDEEELPTQCGMCGDDLEEDEREYGLCPCCDDRESEAIDADRRYDERQDEIALEREE